MSQRAQQSIYVVCSPSGSYRKLPGKIQFWTKLSGQVESSYKYERGYSHGESRWGFFVNLTHKSTETLCGKLGFFLLISDQERDIFYPQRARDLCLFSQWTVSQYEGPARVSERERNITAVLFGLFQTRWQSASPSGSTHSPDPEPLWPSHSLQRKINSTC